MAANYVGPDRFSDLSPLFAMPACLIPAARSPSVGPKSVLQLVFSVPEPSDVLSETRLATSRSPLHSGRRRVCRPDRKTPDWGLSFLLPLQSARSRQDALVQTPLYNESLPA